VRDDGVFLAADVDFFNEKIRPTSHAFPRTPASMLPFIFIIASFLVIGALLAAIPDTDDRGDSNHFIARDIRVTWCPRQTTLSQ